MEWWVNIDSVEPWNILILFQSVLGIYLAHFSIIHLFPIRALPGRNKRRKIEQENIWFLYLLFFAGYPVSGKIIGGRTSGQISIRYNPISYLSIYLYIHPYVYLSIYFINLDYWEEDGEEQGQGQGEDGQEDPEGHGEVGQTAQPEEEQSLPRGGYTFPKGRRLKS